MTARLTTRGERYVQEQGGWWHEMRESHEGGNAQVLGKI